MTRPPIIHEAITLSPDPTEFMPVEVNSAFPEGAESRLTSVEKAKIDDLIAAVPDKNDTRAINYWRDMDDKKVYLEGWIDQCLAGTGFPLMGGGEWDDKIEYMVRAGHRTLIEKQEERNRPFIGPGYWPLVEGGFREFEAGDKDWLYGVTWGVYEISGNPHYKEPESDNYTIPKTLVTSLGVELELPVARAVVALIDENPWSSGFHGALNQRWTIVFRGKISDKAAKAAQAAGLEVAYREAPVGSGQILTDVSLPSVGITQIEKATQAFNRFAELYEGNPMMVHRGTDPEAIVVAERLGLTFDGMQEDLYQFTVAEGPEKAKGITFYVKDLSQVEARLHEKLKEFGIEGGNPPPIKARARIFWTRERTDERIKILQKLGLEQEPYWAQPWDKLPSHYKEAIAIHYSPTEGNPGMAPDKGLLVAIERGSAISLEEGNPMITDVDTALKDIADWYVDTRRGITEPELESILLKHCGSEAEVQKFVKFLETEPGQLRFKTLLRERKGNPGR